MENSNREKQRTAYVVSHTHWDREWRWPIWETRQMLVDFMDELLELLESGKVAGFLLDGQVIPVLDYLEMRPEMAQRIKSLIAEEKLQIGPWFSLPDEYPVDGEALVRNLLWGIREADALGAAFRVGYTPFGWGQTAQLPQIYAGFAMDVAMVGKRVSRRRAPQSEFLWRSPDGSELLATRFGDDGRANFYFGVHLSILFGIDHKGSQWTYDWANGGIAYHEADRQQMEQDHFRLDAPAEWHPEFVTPELIEAAWHSTDDSLLKDDRLMMNGSDYAAAQPMLPEMLQRINEVDPDKTRKWRQATMPEFIELMKEKIDRSKLRVVDGELRDGPAGPLTGNALATRLHIKRLNKQAQNMLIRFAEPMAAIAAMAGAEYPQKFLERAWRYLLEAHPHDSINGATQDETVLDVRDRLRQVINISQAIGGRAMQELVRKIGTGSFCDDDVLLIVFNPLPYPRKEVIEAWVNMPDRRDKNETWRAYRPAEGLQVFDADGNAISTQNQGYTAETYCVSEAHTRAFPYHCLRHRIFFESGEIPAGGYQVFRAAIMDESQTDSTEWSDSFARTGTLLKSLNVLENEHLVVGMNPNGTFDLTDKETGNTFSNLNYYEDRGEHGDYWFNERPMFDEVHTSLGCAARIWSEESGPLRATLASEIVMRLPKRGNKEQKRRGNTEEGFVIKTAVTLRAGQKYAEINVEFDNRHEDHYLRAMFPTGLSGAEHADAGGHFAVDHRPIRPQGPTDNSEWPDMATQPMNNFVDVSDGHTALAIISDSLTEYEVLDNKERTIALSLLRGVRNWICTEMRVGSGFPSQKGGQCLGRHTIRYGIMPHQGNWQDVNIPLAGDFFNAALRPVQTGRHASGLLAKQASLFEIANPLLRFSAIKRAEDGTSFVVRLCNPTSRTQEGDLKFAVELRNAWVTDLNEEREHKLPVKGNTISITAEPHKIVTLAIEPQH